MIWTALTTFFRIGLFTIGGGYAMIPMIEREVVEKRGWIQKDEFLDLVAVAQTCPGVFAINISVFIGYRLSGYKGSMACALGAMLPSLLIILAIALFFEQFKDNAFVAAMFKGIRPAVVALIAAPVFTMAKTAKLNRYNIWIPVLAALMIWLLGVNPVWVIISAGVAGYFYGLYREEVPDR